MADFRNEARQAQALGGGIAGALPKMDLGNQMIPEKQYYEDRCAQEPLRTRLERRLSDISVDAEKIMRLKAILDQHPEFETFIEFTELLNRTRMRQ